MSDLLDRLRALRVTTGTYLTWCGEELKLGHVDRPMDEFIISDDLARALLVCSTNESWGLGFVRRGNVEDPETALGALEQLVSVGVLEPSSDHHPRNSEDHRVGFFAARHQQLVPDVSLSDPSFLDLYEKYHKLTFAEVPTAFAYYSAVQYVCKASVPGDVVECGVWRGGAAAIAAAAVVQSGQFRERRVFLYDTFSWSWEPPTEKDGYCAAPGSSRMLDALTPDAPGEGYAEEVRAVLMSTGLPENQVVVVPGLVEETLPRTRPEQIAVLRLDTDLYESTLIELETLYPLLAVGGVLLVDDYGKLSGPTAAVDEYFEGREIPLFRVDRQGRIGVKVRGSQ